MKRYSNKFIVLLGTTIAVFCSVLFVKAAPTSTIVNNLFITGLSSSGNPCLNIGSNGLVATSTCGGAGGGTTTTINGVSGPSFTFNTSSTGQLLSISTSTGVINFVTSPTSTPTFSSTTLSNFTAGSVPFVGTGGALTQSNSNLFFDLSTNRLGVGTPSPSSTFHVVGNSTFTGNATVSGNVTTTNLTVSSITGSTQCLHVNSTGVVSGAGGDCLTSAITSLNGLTTSTQLFATSTDTNVVLTITSSGATHTFAPGWTGQLGVTRGGTALSSLAQGDLIYGSASNVFSALSKDTNATRYLANTGTTNNPKWDFVNLSNGVTSTLTIGNGGTGIATAPTTNGQLLMASSTGWVVGGLVAGSNITITTSTGGQITIAGSAASISGTAPNIPFFNTATTLGNDNNFKFVTSTRTLFLASTGTQNLFIGDTAGNAIATNATATGNTFIGYQAGTAMVTGDSNTFIGANSGSANDGASNNTFVGYNSGKINSSGQSNAFFGAYAGSFTTTGNQNSAFGQGALQNNATGSSNTALGYDAGLGAKDSNGTFIGWNAGRLTTFGSANTFVGSGAGSSTTTGTNNIALGFNAGSGATVTSTVAIGNNLIIPQSNSGSIGGSGFMLGLGTVSPSSTLHVVGGGITQSGGNNSLTTTTISGRATTTQLSITGISGSTQCLQANTNGIVSGTGSSCGGSYWVNVPGSPVRVSNTQFTITDASCANGYAQLFSKGRVLMWTETSTQMGMVSSSSCSTPTTTVNIVGDVLNSSFTAMKYAPQMADKVTALGVAGPAATGTTLGASYYTPYDLKIFGAQAYVAAAGTTGTTTIDINKQGTTMFTTKIDILSGATSSQNGLYTADTNTTASSSDLITLDIDVANTTNATDLYVNLYTFPYWNIKL